MMSTAEITREISKIAKDYPITKASLFGSYADGRATEESDVDMLVEFATPTISLFTLSEIKFRMEDALGKNVDVIHGPLSPDAMIEERRVIPIYEA